jgi:metal-responsive CopG/Arc/MetJ family transcriptional regulator
MFGLRIPNELMAEIAKWAEANDTNRSEAIRRLVEIGLKAKEKK